MARQNISFHIAKASQSNSGRCKSILSFCKPLLLLLAGSVTQLTLAANLDYQNFFFAVCTGSPTGDLGIRCASTPDGGGDISGDSETSLNPSQPLSGISSAFSEPGARTSEIAETIDSLEETGTSAFTLGGLSVLINASVSSFEQDRNATNTERGLEGDSNALNVGLDYRMSERTVVGGFIDYQSTTSDFAKLIPAGSPFTSQATAGGIDFDSYGFTLFNSHYFNDTLFFEGSIGYSVSDYEFERSVVFQESTRTLPQVNVNALGKTDGHRYFASFGFGVEAGSGAFSITPHFRTGFSQSSIDSYTEIDRNNSGLEMNFNIEDRSSFTTNLGFNASYAIGTSWGVLSPQMRLEWEHEFDQDAQQVTTSFVLDADQNQFALTGDDPDRNYYNLGVAAVAVFSSGWIGFIDYEAVLGYEDLDRSRFTLGLRIEM